MPIQLGSTSLIVPTAETLAAADALLPARDGDLWITPAPPLAGYRFNAPETLRLPRPRRVNEFYWPAWGLSRWAFGYFLASADQAVAVSQQAFGSGGVGGYARLLLRLWAIDPRNNEAGTNAGFSAFVDHPVWVLPPRPIGRGGSALESSRGLYLIPVVDGRYWLQFKAVPESIGLTCESGWGALYDTLEAAAGISMTRGKIEAGFGRPPADLELAAHQSIAGLLDTVAACVGHRIVALADGTFRAQPSAEAISLRDTADAAFPSRPRTAGGSFPTLIL